MRDAHVHVSKEKEFGELCHFPCLACVSCVSCHQVHVQSASFKDGSPLPLKPAVPTPEATPPSSLKLEPPRFQQALAIPCNPPPFPPNSNESTTSYPLNSQELRSSSASRATKRRSRIEGRARAGTTIGVGRNMCWALFEGGHCRGGAVGADVIGL